MNLRHYGACQIAKKKHIRLECPPNLAQSSFNYKKFNSIVLQAVVNSRTKFLFADFDDYQSNNNCGVFSNSNFKKFVLEHQTIIPSPP